jgi:nucleoside-diphosphate-sugar epimerase
MEETGMIPLTGGAKFMGSHLLAELLRQGRNVRILDNLSTGKKENLEGDTNLSLPKIFFREPGMKILQCK